MRPLLHALKRALSRFIPPERRFRLQDRYYGLFGGFRRHHYSQLGEDIALTELVRLPERGVYVDVGAHHPKRYSNTYLLHKRGWHGINIDPNPLTCQLFRKARPKDITLEVGIGSRHSEMTYFMFSDPAVNTFSEEQAELWSKRTTLLDKRAIRIVPLSEVLEKHLPSDEPFGLLDVDAEGMDIDVLRSNDWTRFRPLAVVVEMAHFEPGSPHSDEVFCFLEEKGYDLAAYTGFTGVFFEREFLRRHRGAEIGNTAAA